MDRLILKAYESDNDTNTYALRGQVIEVSNDGASTIKIKANGIEVDVLKGEFQQIEFGRFDSVKITATSTAYRLYVYDYAGD